MSCTIRGGSPLQKKLVAQAIDTYGQKLMPDIWRELVYDVELVANLYKKHGAKGDCIWDDDERPYRDFEIRIDSMMNTQAMLRALAHEMVHVKQYAFDELVDKSITYVFWQGKKHLFTEKNYWDQPWEIEAYGKELGLYEHFIKTRKYSSKRWYRDTDYL